MEENLFNWYSFRENSTLLEIQPYTEVTSNFLATKTQVDVATAEDVQKIDSEKKYNYVVLYDVSYLEYAKRMVKSDGTILLITNNRFGISYWAGGSYNGRLFTNIENDSNEVYTRKELIEVLENNNLNHYKFYYPLPNYKNPNVIFSDNYLPKKNETKISYSINYENNSVVIFDEIKVMRQIIKNDLFKDFANSFFVEINMENNFDLAKFISFNNNRKEEYRLITIIYNDKVEKRAITELGKTHIANIKRNIENLKNLDFDIIDEESNGIIISPYINQDTFDKTLVDLLKKGEKNLAIELISKWYDYIKLRLVKNDETTLNPNIKSDGLNLDELTILKNGYIDLVFENTFLCEDNFRFFDQEWYLEGIPLEFILYRAINNLYIYNSDIENVIAKDTIMEHFNLLKDFSLYSEIERFFQQQIIDEEKVKYNNNSIKLQKDINETGVLLQQIRDFEKNDIKQNQYIKSLEDDNKNKQKYIELLEEKLNKSFSNYIRNVFKKGDK